MRSRVVSSAELTAKNLTADHYCGKKLRYISSNWVSDEHCDYCTYAVAVFDKKFIEEMAQKKKMFLSLKRKDASLTSIHFTDSLPDYYNKNVTDAELENGHILDEGELPKEPPERTDLDHLVVCERGFYWKCYPRHLTVSVETDLVEWKEVGL